MPHEAYAKDILKRYKMEDINPVATPMELGAKLSKFEGGDKVDPSKFRSLVGSLRYLTCTRPDIAYSVGVVSRFMEEPRYSHRKAIKRILGTFEVHNHSGYTTRGRTNTSWWATRTVIGVEMLTIEKAQQVMCFTWEILHLHGFRRNSQ